MKHTGIGRREALLAFGLPALAQTAAAQSTAAPEPKKHRIVMEMSLAGMDAWKHAVQHIGVLRNAFKNDVQLEMVCLGEGLAVLKKTDTELQSTLERAAQNGVVFAACQNSMRSRNVKSEDLFPFATEVPSGLAEVVLKQETGWSYLKLSWDEPAK